jgi:hypothetical protein
MLGDKTKLMPADYVFEQLQPYGSKGSGESPDVV